jgi:hypothetical protein
VETYKRRKEIALFVVTIGLLIACIVVIVRQGYSTDAQAWARSTAALIAGAFLGYITGQSSKS